MIKASIVGATGYTGQELMRLLSAHPEVEFSILTSRSFIGKKPADVFPSLMRPTRDNKLDVAFAEEDFDRIAENSDVVFIALPHAMAAQKLQKKHLSKARFIDLGADFRLQDPADYKQWYGLEHPNPDLLKDATYGLVELNRSKIHSARLIANPGCYATCSILSVLPLLQAGLVDPDSIVVDAKSGASGAGRSLALDVHFNECNETIKAYKVASHRHTPEIEQELQLQSGLPKFAISFTPHLIPMQRGILATAYARLKKAISADQLHQAFIEQYGTEPFIRVQKSGSFPETRWVKGSNYFDVGVAVDARTNRAVVIGAIDNLMKGAASQAIQNMNIMFEFPEHTGIDQIPIFP